MPAPGAPPRCHLCHSREEIEPDDSGLWWCVDVPECNYRARLRLHVQKDEALRLLEIERLGVLVGQIAPESEPETEPDAPAREAVRPDAQREPSHGRILTPHERGVLAETQRAVAEGVADWIPLTKWVNGEPPA